MKDDRLKQYRVTYFYKASYTKHVNATSREQALEYADGFESSPSRRVALTRSESPEVIEVVQMPEVVA